MSTIGIAIAEDHSRTLDVIIGKLKVYDDLKVVCVAENGQVLLDLLRSCGDNVHLVLTDIQMPALNGIETTALLKKEFPHIKVLALTIFDDDANVFEMILAGASGYLLKDIDAEGLYRSICEVMEGGGPMSPAVAFKVLEYVKSTSLLQTNAPEIEMLTKREREILEWIKTGMQNKEIAHQLNISPQTVRKHLENIYDKLHVNNRVEAIKKLP